MGAWNSSSLAASDTNGMRHEGSGLLKNTPTRISKQHLTEHKMFGSKRKGIQIGKMFRKKGKGTGIKNPVGAKMEPPMKGGGISPSIDEFDKMMNSVSKKSSKGGGVSGKSGFFSRKSFG